MGGVLSTMGMSFNKGFIASVIAGWVITTYDYRITRLRYIFGGALSSAVLLLPQGSPYLSEETMMKAVLCSVLSITILKSSSFPEKNNKPLVGSFMNWLKKFLSYLIPIRAVSEEKKKTGVALFTHVTEYLFWALLKLLCAPVVESLLVSGIKQHPHPSYPVQMYLGSLFCVKVLCNYLFDLLVGLTPLISSLIYKLCSYLPHSVRPSIAPQYQYSDFFNKVFLSENVRDFWSNRYNTITRDFLHQNVFVPARTRLMWSSFSSAMLSFVTSGILHMIVVHYTFGYGHLRALLFFFIHGIVASFYGPISKPIQTTTIRSTTPTTPRTITTPRTTTTTTTTTTATSKKTVTRFLKPLHTVLTFSFLIATLPLYIGRFVETDFVFKNEPHFPSFIIKFLNHVLQGRMVVK